MNLRDIKKDIEYVLSAAVDLYNGLRDRLGKPEGAKRAYFDAIRKELLEKVDALYDRLSAAVKKGLGE